jgi:tRNA pseudouridine55 synthase
MVVGVGQATRLLGMLTLDEKRYRADIRFGTQTSTDDAEGEVIRRAEVPGRLGEQAVAEAVVSSLVGSGMQRPPAVSAIHLDGVRAYERVRKGEDVQVPERPMKVFEAALVEVRWDDDLVWTVELRVSKGTYIRSIARDLGMALDSGAFLSALRREQVGDYTLTNAVALEDVEQFLA